MRVAAVAFYVAMIGAGAVACSGASGNPTSAPPQDHEDAGDDTNHPPVDLARDASSLDASVSDSGSSPDADSGVTVPPPPALRLVHLWPSNFRRVNVCAHRHGEPPSATPLSATPLSYTEITPYFSVPAGTYDFRIILEIGGSPGSAATDCLSDAGYSADGLTGVVVTGPTTLTVHSMYDGEPGMFAFADKGTPVPAMNNIRARNANSSNVTIRVHSLIVDQYWGPIQPGHEWPMQVFGPNDVATFAVSRLGSGSYIVSVTAPDPPGTWDIFTYRTGPNTSRLVACRESTFTTSCQLGL